MSTILTIITAVLIVFFMQRIFNSCPFRKKHDWEYVGTEIHNTYKGPVKYKKYVCKNCGKIEYE